MKNKYGQQARLADLGGKFKYVRAADTAEKGILARWMKQRETEKGKLKVTLD